MNEQEMQDALVARAASLKSWLSGSPERTIESLMIRKFESSVVLHGNDLSLEDEGVMEFPLQLLIQQSYRLWSINLVMSIRPTASAGTDGEIIPCGLLFQVIDNDGVSTPVLLLRTDLSPSGMDPSLDNESWCHFWLQKFLKQHDVKMLFGYKSLVSES
ncbi:hypothetical protein GCM10023116_06490 [Kistimonas scapharcae]|uniref:Uncharacterized protein n=1 Tax=Kistimonas scapharcae TaxID=1036133 RepID=A0ABP8UXN7_9GAMM